MKKPNASVEPPNTDFDPNDFGQASDLMESVAGNLKGISLDGAEMVGTAYGGSVITASTFGSVGRISRQSPRYRVALPIVSIRMGFLVHEF